MLVEYIKNSRAVLDSLLRYQDAKRLLELSSATNRALQSQMMALTAEKIKALADANEMAVRLFDCNEAYAAKDKKWKAANLECWLWRLGAGVGAALVVRQWAKPP